MDLGRYVRKPMGRRLLEPPGRLRLRGATETEIGRVLAQAAQELQFCLGHCLVYRSPGGPSFRFYPAYQLKSLLTRCPRCCIDKSSSAELAEAINSMFLFYSQADLCIAYITDVPTDCQAWEAKMYHFRRSEWFTRGWTLQELLASGRLHFYDHGFNFIGSKSQLCKEVSKCTSIAPKYLDGRKRFNDASIATRMSWASRRQTTRHEDEAYCLLGIFGVSIPPCYGEGAEAFYRLQREILARSDDESIFAWISKDAKDDEPFGLLAESPRDFMESACVDTLPTDSREPISLTGRGIAFGHGFPSTSVEHYYTGFGEWKQWHERKIYLRKEGKVTLACNRRPITGRGRDRNTIAIVLRKMNGGWYRVKCNRFHYTSAPLHSHYFQTFYVPQPFLTTTPRFQENRREVGEFARRQIEQRKEEIRAEEMREGEKWRRREKLMVESAVVLGAVVGVHQLTQVWNGWKEQKSREDPKSSTGQLSRT